MSTGTVSVSYLSRYPPFWAASQPPPRTQRVDGDDKGAGDSRKQQSIDDDGHGHGDDVSGMVGSDAMVATTTMMLIVLARKEGG